MADPHDHHHHDHHHDHHHHGDRESNLSSDQKLRKRLEHWVAHNNDHAKTYREWAGRTADRGMSPVSKLLEEAAQVTMEISHKLEDAIRLIPKE